MFKVLVSDNVAKEGLEILEAVDGIQVDFKTGMTPDELKAVIGGYDALIVRSATKVREEIIAAATNLKVIGRAGAGVDNIDVAKATDAGIVVMNTPGGNTVSTAEHAFSLIMALSRNIPQSVAAVKSGEWTPKKYTGVELRGKTLGIIGLGNIGRTLATRAAAFEMKVVGYDPFISKEMAQRYTIETVPIEKIWEMSDYISLHTPLNDSTRHLVNAETLAKCKDGVRIINCARGGIVKEDDLLAAIESGKVAGAALDVYEKEPPTGTAIIASDKVVCTPHLGASTTEAQDIVAVMVAEQVRDFLVTGEVKNAINMPSLAPEVYEQIKPYITLCKNMGSFLGQMGTGQLKGIDITYFGDIHTFDTWNITSSALEGLFTRGYAENVNLLNARSTAEKLGIKVNEIKSSEEKEYKNCIEVAMKTDAGDVSLLGTVFGKNDFRVVRFNGYDIDFIPDGNMLVCGNEDRPGVIGAIGTVLGEKGINIARMTWARKAPAGDAVVVLTTDEKVGKDILDVITAVPGISSASAFTL